MSAMTGTPEDAEAAWQAYNAEVGHDADLNPMRYTLVHRAFLAGFAARPSVTVDEITELLAEHGPRDNYDEGEYIGYICRCRTKESGPYDTDYMRHVASVVVAHITGEGGRND